MKYLKRFNEAFGQDGMFDWKVADMKHTPSSRAQLGLDKDSNDKENQKGTFKYFMALSNDELKDYQKNFTNHGFENPAEHNPEYVAWKTACEIKKVFSK